MLAFLVLFLSIYGGMHAMVLFRLRSILPTGSLWILLLVGLLLLTTAPVTFHLLQNGGYQMAARWTAWVGYGWMGFVFVLFVISLIAALLEGVFWGLQKAGIDRLAPVSAPAVTWALLLVAAMVCIYGFYEARTMRIERIRFHTDALPAGSVGMKIVQISDLHLGLCTSTGRIDRLAQKIQAESPDILVSTGDLMDGRGSHIPHLAAALRRIRTPLGKYAVTGNHEYYAGLDQALDFTRSCGFTILRSQVHPVATGLMVAGVDEFPDPQAPAEAELLATLPNPSFVLLLKHQPSVDPQSLDLFDLQLSGHTHHGQIFPFTLLVAWRYPLMDGIKRLTARSTVYTSRGTGTWGPPMRILAPPEITVIEIAPSS